MKIDVKRLGEEPEPLELALDSAWFARELYGTLHEDGQAEGGASLFVSRVGAKVQVSGQVRARFDVACGRCLEAAEVRMDEPFVMVFEEPTGRVPAAEVELSEEDLHWESFDGQEIDLSPLMREQLLLAVPMTPLCRPDCPGLTDQLEAIPEEERLEIDGKPVDPRWNALAKLKPTR